MPILNKFFQSKTTTFTKAKENNEISEEVCVWNEENVLVCGNGLFYYQNENSLPEVLNKALRGGVDSEKNPIDSKPHYSNFHLTDVFGNYHQFFRPYTYKTKKLIVRTLPKAYARTNIDLVFTKSKKVLLSYTNLRTHLLDTPKNPNIQQALVSILRLSKNWLKLFYIPFYARKIIKLSGSVALLTRDVGDNYGHFINEVMMGLYQIRLSKKKVDFYILPQNYSFQKELPKILGINESQVIPATKSHLIFAQELIIPTLLNEYEIVEYRKYTHFRIFYQPSLIKHLYAEILSQSSILPTRKIFFTRPKDSNRNIINNDEVEAILKEFGFEIILPDSLSIQKQIELMQECKILAGMHGSSLINSIFLNKHATLFELFSEYYHDNCPHYIALAKGCKYFYMIGKTPDTSMHPQQENTYIEPNTLRKALENIKKYVEF